MKLADLAPAKLTTLKGLWTVRQKDTELYLSACDLAADVIDATNDREQWLIYPDVIDATNVVAEISALEAKAAAADSGYSVTHYEAIPLDQVAELEYDLTSKGSLVCRVVKLGGGNGPLKAFLRETLKRIKQAHAGYARDIKQLTKDRDAAKTQAQREYHTALKNADRTWEAEVRAARADAAEDERLMVAVEKLLNPPAPKSRARNAGRPLARSMTQKKAAARRGATGVRKGKAKKGRRGRRK